jgi:hypothetical protein
VNLPERLLAILDPTNSLSRREIKGQGLILGENRPVPWRRYRHIIYSPLTSPDVTAVEAALGRPLPVSMKDTLQECNGLSLFGDSLSLFGLRRSFVRMLPESIQPFSITTPNLLEQPARTPSGVLYVGAYRDDGSLLGIGPDGSVLRTPRSGFVIKQAWLDLNAALVAEACQLQQQWS